MDSSERTLLLAVSQNEFSQVLEDTSQSDSSSDFTRIDRLLSEPAIDYESIESARDGLSFALSVAFSSE
jgi:hypothetical protein